jgi:hypothetical protein
MNRKIFLIILISCVLFSGCTSSESLGKGTLQMTSSPSGAEVYLDHQFRGSTPCTIADVDTGNHTLEFRYPGYQSWATVIAVPSGTSHYFAALTSQQNNSSGQGVTGPTPSPAEITVRANSAVMVIGDSQVFSGTCTGCDKVLLTLYGPGYYAKGVSLESQKINSVDAWSYTWNPGYTIQSGGYTLLAEDGQKTASDRVEFSVIGGGEVSISSNSYSAIRGDTLRLSGRCTTGAKTVVVSMYGPGQYSSGIQVGTASVTADDNWNLRYTLDSSMPTGLYTMSVHDIPQTASSTIQFSVRAL